jgi:TolA-binding protein
MTRRGWASARALALAALLSGCGSGADELMETAAFEELQNNPAHARQLYEQVVKQYPGTPEAAKASERLRALGSAP